MLSCEVSHENTTINREFDIGSTHLYTLLIREMLRDCLDETTDYLGVTKEFAFFVVLHMLDKQRPADHDNLC